MTLRFLAIGLIAALASVVGFAQQPAKPPPAPTTVPDLESTRPVVLCVDCDAPFDTATHATVLKGLLANPYVRELRKALYLQDSVHQFQSKAHFDNCDFDSSIDYIDELLAEAGKHVAVAGKARIAGKTSDTQTAIQRAFFALGQALHGVQDFYAHTNYVEVTKRSVSRVTDWEVIAPWRAAGKARIKQLQSQGLVSGVVFWGFPQKCPAGTMSHSDLAKDSESTKSGSVRVPHLQNLSHYRIAAFLAREASLELLRDAFKRWPLLKEFNGANVAFEVLIDRRPEQ